jgi:hypothetical protein
VEDQQWRLAGGMVPADTGEPAARARVHKEALLDVIDRFLTERTNRQNPASVRRLRRELGEFAVIANKKFLKDLTPGDLTAYWTWLREKRKCAPRTIFNRIQGLQTFLRECGATRLLLKKNQMPKYDERSVDYFTESDSGELNKFFAFCSAQQKLAFQFFLFTGAREREVMHFRGRI